MKFFFLMICMLVTIAIFAQRNIDVLHYKFNIGLNDNNDTIQGLAKVTVRFLQDAAEMTLDLNGPAQTGKGMRLGKIDGPKFRRSIQAFSTVTIQFAENFRKGDTATFSIPYSGIPADGLIISKTKYGKRSFFADNWPNRGHNWLPCHDVPYDKATVEFVVTAPLHYQVVANGVQVEETQLDKERKLTHWKEDVPISTKVMVIGVADFAVGLSGMIDNCIPVYSWVYPEDRDKGFYDYSQAMEILPFFTKNVGPYAYKKLANVQSKTTFGGLENANTIFYSEGSVSGNRRSEALIAHEIAHQWFGNMATEKTFAHLWLSEGFATYMTILYLENKYGVDTAIHMLKQDRSEVIAHAKTSNRPVVDTTSDYMELLNANSYQKGGWILHMLRSELGDSVFWQGIRKYYSTYAGSTADTDDLRKILENVSGKNLELFFRQWLFTPGVPQLDIQWSYARNKVDIFFRQLQPLPFDLKIDINIITGSGTTKKTIALNTKDKMFTFDLPVTPTRIEIDPQVKLLADWKIVENKYGVGTGGK